MSTTRGIALYVGALLGPGLLVLSGLVAVVFARFGVGHPSGAGVAEYARLGLGTWAGRAVGWCFLAGIIAAPRSSATSARAT